MDDPVAEFAGWVETKQCRIINTPSLLFLCGGPVEQEPKPYQSARDYFNRYLLKNEPAIAQRRMLAEELIGWFDQNTFDDVLELEEFLADLSDLIILFVESPGALAELGAFAASPSLRRKTLAIRNSRHRTSRSFIADGPIRRMLKLNPDSVLGYDWPLTDLSHPTTLEILDLMSRDLVEYLANVLGARAKEQPLNPKSDGHAMLAAADIIDLAGILMVGEIQDCLTRWGFSVDRRRVRQYIFLLENLGLVQSLLHLKQQYYVVKQPCSFISYGFRPGASVRDRDRAKVTIRRVFENLKDRRVSVLRNHVLTMPAAVAK